MMWPGNLSRQAYLSFLVEHAELVLDQLLITNAYDLDCIVMDNLQDQLTEYRETEFYWEAC